MKVKLRVCGDSSQVAHNPRARTTSTASASSFYLIGSGEECFLRCRSDLVSARHCVVAVNRDQAIVKDLNSNAGVFLNGRKVQSSSPLANGDRLTVGDIEFEFLVAKQARPVPKQEPGAGRDREISDWLLSVDEAEKERYQANPELRKYQPDPALIEAKRKKRELEEAQANKSPSDEENAQDLKKAASGGSINSDSAAASMLEQRYGNSISKVFRRPTGRGSQDEPT